MSKPSPLIGAIVFAWLPDDQRPHVPGPKFRPVLIVEADVENKRLLVAYGTSQKLDLCYPGEIVFQPEEIDGLSKATKFCLGKSKWIPISSEYLSKSRKNGGLAVLGRVPKHKSDHMLARATEVAHQYQ